MGINVKVFNGLRRVNGNLHPLISWEPNIAAIKQYNCDENKRVKIRQCKYLIVVERDCYSADVW